MSTITEADRDHRATAANPRPRPRRKLVLAVVAVLLLAGGYALVTRWLTHSDHDTFGASDITTIVIDHDAGDVTLVSSPTPGRAEVTTNRRWSVQRPGRVGQVEHGVLTLTGGCPTIGIGTCRVEQQIAVPAGVTVRVRVDSGEIRAAGVELEQLDVDVDAGKVTLDQISVPQLTTRTGSGAIVATLTTVPSQLTATTGSGNITLEVPRHAYQVEAGTGAGQVHVGVEESADATEKITAHSGSGNVIIRP